MNETHTQSRPMNKATQGFTLIELAVVLFVVGLLLAGMLGPLSTQIEFKERSQTESKLSETVEAIYGFAIQNGRLPCPDTDLDGDEDCGNTTGGIPWSDLGVDRDDAWAHNILFRVTTTFTDATDGTGCGTATAGISFELCSNGDITVLDAAAGNNVATNVPAILVSKGKHRWRPDDASADEDENFEQFDIDATTETVPTDTLGSFVTRDYADDFDDIAIWISPHILRNKMLNAGRLP